MTFCQRIPYAFSHLVMYHGYSSNHSIAMDDSIVEVHSLER
jgi:hypothetical protein